MPHRRTGPVAAVSVGFLALTVPAALAASLTGTDGDDTITGTAEDDSVFSLAGNDTVLAGLGDDEVFGAQGDDRLVGDFGNDLLNGGGGADVLEGGYGGDVFRLRGADRASGGPQRDTFTWNRGALEVHGGPGQDRVDGGGPGSQQVHGGGGADALQLVRPLSTRTVLTGGGGDDQVGVAVDLEDGAATIALVSGGAGDDGVYGGARRLRGGSGDDSLTMNVAGHVWCGTGTDIVSVFDRGATISDACEDVTVFLDAHDGETLVGTTFDDYVFDGAGDETIRTLEGDDHVQDLNGSDTIDLGPGDDQFESNATGGVDTITCGSGEDTVYVTPDDVVAADCETVLPR